MLDIDNDASKYTVPNNWIAKKADPLANLGEDGRAEEYSGRGASRNASKVKVSRDRRVRNSVRNCYTIHG